MDTNGDFPDMMDTHQVAKYLRIKERKVYDLLKERRIPSVRVTGKWLFPKNEIDAWLKRNSAPAAQGGVSATMVVAGSHDPLLDWALREVGGRLAVLPGSSEDGLARMAAGEAWAAGMHLLEPESGDYNVPRARQALDGRNVVLIHWAWRHQGLVVAPGNPLKLGSIADLIRSRARVVARQEGSGSRILLRHLLDGEGFDWDALVLAPGLARTETDVGLAILEGSGDAGLAVEAVARSLRLDFIPLHRERFDLAVDRQAYFEPPIQALLAFAHTQAFTTRAQALGYDISALGAVLWNAA